MATGADSGVLALGHDHSFNVSKILASFRLRDSYKPVSKASFIDETLFAKTEGIVIWLVVFHLSP